MEGDFHWHKHDDTDEFFLVFLEGRLDIDLEDRVVSLAEHHAFTVPKGVMHCPHARGRVVALMVDRRCRSNRKTHPMVICEWRGRALLVRSDAYPKHFRERVVPELQTIAGFRSARRARQPPRNRRSSGVSRPHPLGFYGCRARVRRSVDRTGGRRAGAVAALIDFDDTVRHYEVIEEASATSQAA